MELDIDFAREEGMCIMSLKGEVDVYTSPWLKKRLVEAVDEGCTELVVDMEGVDFIDSSGLGVLVSALKRVKEHSGWMGIVCSKESILKIFRITGLDKVFPMFSSVEDARASEIKS